jgi:hypothetical protein
MRTEIESSRIYYNPHNTTSTQHDTVQHKRLYRLIDNLFISHLIRLSHPSTATLKS